VAWLRWLDQGLAKLERTVIVLLLSGLLGLGLLQVLARNLFASGLFWADELLQHLVLWLGVLGASLATREQRHLRLDVLTYAFPARYQPWLALLVHSTACLACSVLTWAAWELVRSEHAAGTMLTFGVPGWMAQSIVPLGLLSIAWRFLLHGLDALWQLTLQQRRP